MRGRLFTISFAVLLMLSVGLTGCNKGDVPGRSGTGAATGPLGGPEALPPLGASGDIAVGERGAAVAGGWQAGQFQAVYFGFDSARVHPEELGKLEAVAGQVGAGTKLVVEGHADERGTAEYNRALGERRALACREELVRLGVPAGNISTISHGEDNPAAFGHDEESWSQNRRCEFAIVGQ